MKARGKDPGEYGLEDADPTEEELPECDLYWLKIFWKLSSCRAVGMGPGPIPWTAIWQYAQMEGQDEDDFQMMELMIFTLDRIFLTWNSEKQDREQEERAPMKSAPRR